MIIYSSETDPKVCEQRKVQRKKGIFGLKSMVPVHLQVALRRTKAGFLCVVKKSYNNWVWKHHMQEHALRSLILLLNCSLPYELNLYAFENWLTLLFLNMVLWKMTRDRSKRIYAGINKAFPMSCHY